MKTYTFKRARVFFGYKPLFVRLSYILYTACIFLFVLQSSPKANILICVFKLDLAQALVSLGKTQHRMCLLPDSLDSLHKALSINERHFGRDYPQVC